MTEAWEKAIRAQVEDKVRAKTVELAGKARDKLFQEFRRIIDVFYSEYGAGFPKYYRRHGGAGIYGSGLHGSYKKYYKNSHDALNGVYGGVEISTAGMPDDYRISSDRVLDDFLDGWHGPSFVGIPVLEGEPYDLIVKYRDKLASDLLR